MKKNKKKKNGKNSVNELPRGSWRVHYLTYMWAACHDITTSLLLPGPS